VPILNPTLPSRAHFIYGRLKRRRQFHNQPQVRIQFYQNFFPARSLFIGDKFLPRPTIYLLRQYNRGIFFGFNETENKRIKKFLEDITRILS
jgi:hypothetical protein